MYELEEALALRELELYACEDAYTTASNKASRSGRLVSTDAASMEVWELDNLAAVLARHEVNKARVRLDYARKRLECKQ